MKCRTCVTGILSSVSRNVELILSKSQGNWAILGFEDGYVLSILFDLSRLCVGMGHPNPWQGLSQKKKKNRGRARCLPRNAPPPSHLQRNGRGHGGGRAWFPQIWVSGTRWSETHLDYTV